MPLTGAKIGERHFVAAAHQLKEVVGIPGPLSYGQLRLHPWWDPLRGDPRFDELVAEARNPVTLK